MAVSEVPRATLSSRRSRQSKWRDCSAGTPSRRWQAGVRERSPWAWCGLLCLVLFSCVQPSVQVLEFLQQPAPSYYILDIPNAVASIPCQIVETLPPEDAQTPVDPTIFINSVPIDPYDPPSRHGLLVQERVVVGLLIAPVLAQDAGTVIWCEAESQGDSVRSRNATILVGDGRPLPPPEPPYQTAETILSTTLEWGVSLTPSHAPILNYSLTFWLQGESRDQAVTVETPDNETTIELTVLQPGGTYNVVVSGWNLIGLGEESTPGVIMMMRGEVPPAPEGVSASVELTARQFTALLTVSWTAVTIDPDTTAPVQNYLLYVTDADSPQPVDPEVTAPEATVPSDVTSHTLTLSVSGRYRVGVAARNNAGVSEVGSYSEIIDIQLQTPPPTDPGSTTMDADSTSGTVDSTSSTTTSDANSTSSLSTAHTTDFSKTTQTSETTPTEPFIPVTDVQSGPSAGSPLIIIISVVIVGCIMLVILSILIFLIIFYLRLKMRDMHTQSINLSNESSESPPPKKRGDLDDKITENGANGSALHYATLPNSKSHSSSEGLIDKEDEHYKSLPMLATRDEQRRNRVSLPLSELGTKC